MRTWGADLTLAVKEAAAKKQLEREQRDMKILKCWLQGLPNKVIAERLGISGEPVRRALKEMGLKHHSFSEADV